MTPPLIVPSITSALTIVELYVYSCLPRVTDVMRKSTALMCRSHMRMQLQQLWYMVHTGAGGASACADVQIRAVSSVPPRDLTHLRGGDLCSRGVNYIHGCARAALYGLTRLGVPVHLHIARQSR